MATGFLVAVGFFVATAFFTGAVFGAVTFFAVAVILTLDFLASLAMAALRRLAVFFFRRPFFTALSYSDWILEAPRAVGFFLKSLIAVRMVFLICSLFLVRFAAWRAAFLADLIIGIIYSL